MKGGEVRESEREKEKEREREREFKKMQCRNVFQKFECARQEPV